MYKRGMRPIRTDRVVLNALLTCGKLSRGEHSAFQAMYDDVVSGRVINLSKKQRLWADSVYDKYKIGEMKSEKRKEARSRILTTAPGLSGERPLHKVDRVAAGVKPVADVKPRS